MTKLRNFTVGLAVAAILLAPIAWADAQRLGSARIVMAQSAPLPDLWKPAVSVVRAAFFSTP